MLCKLLNRIENFENLCLEIQSIIERVGVDQGQIICQTLVEDCEDWKTGIGKIDQLDTQDETLYKYIQPSLKGTQLEQLIQSHNSFRTRIMIMPARHCYSIHRDLTPRIHIPIVTSSQAWMVWPFESGCHRLSEGFAYWTDTTKNHTFLNGGTESRIHLVMCVRE